MPAFDAVRRAGAEKRVKRRGRRANPRGWYQFEASDWSNVYVTPCFMPRTGLATSPHLNTRK